MAGSMRVPSPITWSNLSYNAFSNRKGQDKPMSNLLKSQAGTAAMYVPLQARLYSSTDLHIQGAGVSVNRPYGFALTVAIPSELGKFFAKQPRPLTSLATNAKYAPFQARVRGGRVHCQMVDGGLNRDYGASFDIEDAPELMEFIEKQTEQELAKDSAKATTSGGLKTFYVEFLNNIIFEDEVYAKDEAAAIEAVKDILCARIMALGDDEFEVTDEDEDEDEEDCDCMDAPSAVDTSKPHAKLLD